ncbi:DUF6049 family protein [Streptomyces sp. GC420]|uniref:DUF6049 family protein n=1 Tax=Streptomyces sp. GC420 TaxID=2697568 RepID=UPI0014152909|nr:DUF6049 family protein [Streptomyces sp. GC420]NBM19352.1 hypothetical protein [Streptomyces sp. GC420]
MAEAAQSQETERPRRRLRRFAALLAGAPVLAGLLQFPATSAVAAPAAAGSRTVDVSLDTLKPAAPVEGDNLTVSGTLTNKGKQTITGAHVGLRVGPELNSRSGIDDAARHAETTSGTDPAEVGGKHVQKFAKLPPGATQTFRIEVPVKKLGLGDDGVYQLGVSLSGQTADQPWERVLGIQRTFLPYQQDETEEKTRVSYLWPLISGTHLTAETGSDEEQTPLFKDEDLAKEIGPGGRLQQLVSLGSRLPVTWVIDPDLLATVDAMTGSYEVQLDDGTIVAGENQDVANEWLDQLQMAVRGKTVVALPFADPDVASLAHRGKDVTGSLSHLKDATDVAATTVETVLHTGASTDYAWPVDGAVDPSIIDVATSAGADKVIARSDSLRDGLPYTPNAARPVGDGTTAVVADASLSTAFQGDMAVAENSTLAVQKFLAQSLMITRQDPNEARTVVVAPQRQPTASQAHTMASAIGILESDRWSEAADLTAVADTEPDTRANRKVPSRGSYPKSLRKKELPTSAFEQIKETQRTLEGFKVVLTAKDRAVTPFGNALRRGMSTSWRGNTSGAEDFRKEVQQYLVSLTKKVQLITKSDVTLSGRSATIPVTVQNNLVQGVENLVLKLTSNNPNRLELGDPQPVKVAGGHSQSVKFPASANANGPAEVTAQLYTEDGAPYGDAMTFTLTVTEVTPTVMLVIAGGVLLLVLAGIRMYTQRKRAAARRAAGDDDEEEAEENDASRTARTADGHSDNDVQDRHSTNENAGSEQPSDPTPDTAPESGDPSGAGEKVDR